MRQANIYEPQRYRHLIAGVAIAGRDEGGLEVTASFLVLVAAVVLLSVREWILLLARRKVVQLRETDPVWLPDYASAEEAWRSHAHEQTWKGRGDVGPAAGAYGWRCSSSSRAARC